MGVKLADKVGAARLFGRLLHEGQFYVTREVEGQNVSVPYSEHLEDVYLVLLNFDVLDKDLLAAAFLHDSIEDTGVSKSTILDLFGPRVTELVTAVTDEPGANRKERKAATYPKIRTVLGATTLKLADRITNVSHAKRAINIRMFKMYRNEQAEFEAALRGQSPDMVEPMWHTLRELLRVEPVLPPPRPVTAET